MERRIKIEDTIKSENGWVFEVKISEEGSESSHEVLLDKEYWKKLTAEEMDPGELIQKSFKFLLEREPKESILRSFNLKVIGKYFPEYEEEVTE